MMLSNKYLFITISIIVLVCSCSKPENNDAQVMYPLSATREISDLDSYISELSLIPLWNDSLAISGVSKIIPVDSTLLLLSGGVLYHCNYSNADRVDIQRIGNIGRGPGEYLTLKDFALSLSEDEVICLDISGDILRYSLETKELVGKIQTSAPTGTASGIFPLAGDRIAVYVPNPLDTEMTKPDIVFYSLWIFDYKGEELSKELKWTDLNVMTSFSIPVSVSSGGYYILSPESSSPSLVYKNGELSGTLFLDFGSHTLPPRYAFRKNTNPWNSLGDIFASDYFKLTSSVFVLPDAYFFRAFGKRSSSWNFLVPFNGSKGIRWCSIPKLTPPISAIGMDGDCVFFSYDDYGLNDDEKDPLKKVVLERFGKPAATDGSFLIKAKFVLDKKHN